MVEIRNIEKRTLYDTIRSTIRTSITNGELKPGDRLPTEEQLTVKFRTSRPTINKAIRSLARDGLVETRKRGGTVILAQTQSWIPMLDISQYVSERGEKYSFELLECKEIKNTRDNRLWINVTTNSDILTIECVHYSGVIPIQHEQRLINLGPLSEARNTDFTNQSPSKWLQNNAPWPSLDQTIGAIGAGELIANRLNVRHGTPCIGIHQITRNEDEYLSVATLTCPAGRFSINTG